MTFGKTTVHKECGNIYRSESPENIESEGTKHGGQQQTSEG